MTLQAEPDVGKADVRLCNDRAIGTTDGVLTDDPPQRRVGQTQCKQLLEPEVGNPAFERDSSQLRQQEA